MFILAGVVLFASADDVITAAPSRADAQNSPYGMHGGYRADGSDGVRLNQTGG
jgi:hypothetical protein